jgi:hypothetical protein
MGNQLIAAASGEFLLNYWPNGGFVVLLRSLWVTVLLYAIALALRESLAPGHDWSFSGMALRTAVAETIPWFGAIFAGVYAAFYSRFASQWKYLAELYNQQLLAALQYPHAERSEDREEVMSIWYAAFVEDAVALHLDRKEAFAEAILMHLKKPKVREIYARHSVGGSVDRVARLEARLNAALERQRR